MKEFARLNRLPPYVFTRVNKIKMDARHAGEDIIDLGMGNPDMPTPKQSLGWPFQTGTNAGLMWI
jgi:alanine-synthesizing transaminase